jgi:hypothetical protein
MDKSYKQFVDKLNSYISKFYLYQLIRGLLLFVLLFVMYYSFVSSLEYFNYFNPTVKLSIVIVTLFFTGFIFIYFLFIPTIKLFGIGKLLTYYDVSKQLSKIYPEIKDKLINIVELESETASVYSNELKNASIDQKIRELSIFKFSESIKFKDLKVVFILLLSVLFLFIVAFSFSPDFFKESSVRLIHFQQKFEKPAPYTFHFKTNKLEIISGESIDLELECPGKVTPEMMYINLSGNNYLMTKDQGLFKYRIENVNSSISIFFTDKKYVSDIYRVTVLNKPFISSFSVDIQPPSYTNLSTEHLQNVGDLKIASGTNVSWSFIAVDTDSLTMIFNDSTKLIGEKNGNIFEVARTLRSDVEYLISVRNSKLKDENNLVYKIQTISDLYPEIKVVQVNDSMDFKIFHFKGNIVDDYGFNKLDFTISAEGKDSSFTIPFIPFMLNQDFYYTFDFESVKNFGKSIKYYFSVYDNDFVNHFKKSVSETFTFTFPDYQDILAKENSDQNTIDQLFKKSEKLTEEIQQEFKDFKMKQINSELSEWEKFQTVKDIMSKKTDLENVLNQIKQQNKDANNFLNSFSEEKSDILKKQQQIDELLKDVLSDELKKLFEEFNELAKQFDSKKFDQLSKDMDSGLDDLAKQLDKNVQLLKKMKVEQKVERVIEELKKLAISEKKNLEKLEKRSYLISINDDEKRNESQLKDLENDYNGALEINKDLEKPMNLFNFDNEFSTIKQNYSKVLNESEKGNKRKTSEGIENNSKSLDQLVFALDQMLKNNKSKQNKANIEDIKQILDNLIIVSFDQEKVLNKFNSVDFNNPLINDLKIKQKNLQGQVIFVKDSLYALAKRTPEISSVINKEMLGLENSVVSAFDNLELGNLGGSRMYQQYGITAANNLALFLSEALESIKEKEKNSMPGDGDPENSDKKSSKSGMKSLKESQSSIKEQMQQMIDQMKNGDMGKMSKSIGQTIAQQEIMQQLIRDMVNSGSVGSKASDQLKAIDQLLEQSRRDLINRNVTNELINRQNLILSKLLDAEKSEIERDTEEKRESKTATDVKKSNPEGYFEYNNKIKNENELIKRGNFKLRSFYDQKYNNFLNQIKN